MLPLSPGVASQEKVSCQAAGLPLRPRDSRFSDSVNPISNQDCYPTRTKSCSPSGVGSSLGRAHLGALGILLPWPPRPLGSLGMQGPGSSALLRLLKRGPTQEPGVPNRFYMPGCPIRCWLRKGLQGCAIKVKTLDVVNGLTLQTRNVRSGGQVPPPWAPGPEGQVASRIQGQESFYSEGSSNRPAAGHLLGGLS